MVSLVNLKQSSKAVEETIEDKRPEYPYGMELSLNDETSKKLGLTKDIKAGTEVQIIASGKISSVRVSDDDNDKEEDLHIQIQITDMNVKPAQKSIEDQASKLFPETEEA